jgi:hypothetical protein
MTKQLKKRKKGQAQWLKSVILTTQEVEMGRISVHASSGKKFSRSHLNQSLGTVVCACHPSCVKKHKWEGCSPG